jgi:hypothetical protein
MLKQFHKNKAFSRLMLVAMMIGLTGFAVFAVDSPAAQTSEAAKVIPGEFTDAKAMYLIFGNYNPLTEHSKTILTSEELAKYPLVNVSVPPEEESANVETKDGDESDAKASETESNENQAEPPMEVEAQANFSKAYKQGGTERRILLVTVFSENFSCHTCQPILGGAVFTKVSNGWRLDSFTKCIGQMGVFNIIREGRLVQIGKDRFGVLIQPEDWAQGQFSRDLAIVTEVEGNLRLVCQVNNVDGDNSGNAVPGKMDDQFRFSSKLTFPKLKGSDWFDILIETKGTKPDPDLDSDKLISAKQVLRFTFKDGQYQPVGKQ